jgi:hypothetical protein
MSFITEDSRTPTKKRSWTRPPAGISLKAVKPLGMDAKVFQSSRCPEDGCQLPDKVSNNGEHRNTSVQSDGTEAVESLPSLIGDEAKGIGRIQEEWAPSLSSKAMLVATEGTSGVFKKAALAEGGDDNRLHFDHTSSFRHE